MANVAYSIPEETKHHSDFPSLQSMLYTINNGQHPDRIDYSKEFIKLNGGNLWVIVNHDNEPKVYRIVGVEDYSVDMNQICTITSNNDTIRQFPVYEVSSAPFTDKLTDGVIEAYNTHLL